VDGRDKPGHDGSLEICDASSSRGRARERGRGMIPKIAPYGFDQRQIT
jgi:hypothetical protein